MISHTERMDKAGFFEAVEGAVSSAQIIHCVDEIR